MLVTVPYGSKSYTDYVGRRIEAALQALGVEQGAFILAQFGSPDMDIVGPDGFGHPIRLEVEADGVRLGPEAVINDDAEVRLSFYDLDEFTTRYVLPQPKAAPATPSFPFEVQWHQYWETGAPGVHLSLATARPFVGAELEDELSTALGFPDRPAVPHIELFVDRQLLSIDGVRDVADVIAVLSALGHIADRFAITGVSVGDPG